METGSGRCPVCSDGSENLGKKINCPSCETPHHENCWEYNDNKCAVYACGAMLPEDGVDTDVPPVRTRAGPEVQPRIIVSRQREFNPAPVGFLLMMILTLIAILGFITSFALPVDERVKPGEVIFIRDDLDTNKVDILEDGWKYDLNDPGIILYKKSSGYHFGPIIVKFADNIGVSIHGILEYNLPTCRKSLINLCRFYGEQRDMERRLIRDVLFKVLTMAGRHVSYADLVAEGNVSPADYLLGKVINGIHAVKDDSATCERFNPSLFSAYGFTLRGFQITEVNFGF